MLLSILTRVIPVKKMGSMDRTIRTTAQQPATTIMYSWTRSTLSSGGATHVPYSPSAYLSRWSGRLVGVNRGWRSVMAVNKRGSEVWRPMPSIGRRASYADSASRSRTTSGTEGIDIVISLTCIPLPRAQTVWRSADAVGAASFKAVDSGWQKAIRRGVSRRIQAPLSTIPLYHIGRLKVEGGASSGKVQKP